MAFRRQDWEHKPCGVATSPVVLRWLCDSPRTWCVWRTTPYIYVARTSNKRVIVACNLCLNLMTSVRRDWSWHVNSIVPCCHSAKLCAYAARDFRWQQWQQSVINLLSLSVFYVRGPQIVDCNPKLCRDIFHSGSRNNLDLHFKFAILIKQNKCNHLLFHVLSFIQFCASKLLLSINSSPKIDIYMWSIFYKIICSRNVWVARIWN